MPSIFPVVASILYSVVLWQNNVKHIRIGTAVMMLAWFIYNISVNAYIAAVVELVGSYALFKPMNKAIESSSKQLYNTEGSIYKENPLLLRRYKSITNRVAKLPLNFVTSMLRFSMIYPLSLMLGAMGIVKASQRGEEDKKKLDIKA